MADISAESDQGKQLAAAYKDWLNTAGKDAFGKIPPGTAPEAIAAALVPVFTTWLSSDGAKTHAEAYKLITGVDRDAANKFITEHAKTAKPTPEKSWLAAILSGGGVLALTALFGNGIGIGSILMAVGTFFGVDLLANRGESILGGLFGGLFGDSKKNQQPGPGGLIQNAAGQLPKSILFKKDGSSAAKDEEAHTKIIGHYLEGNKFQIEEIQIRNEAGTIVSRPELSGLKGRVLSWDSTGYDKDSKNILLDIQKLANPSAAKPEKKATDDKKTTPDIKNPAGIIGGGAGAAAIQQKAEEAKKAAEKAAAAKKAAEDAAKAEQADTPPLPTPIVTGVTVSPSHKGVGVVEKIFSKNISSLNFEHIDVMATINGKPRLVSLLGKTSSNDQSLEISHIQFANGYNNWQAVDGYAGTEPIALGSSFTLSKHQRTGNTGIDLGQTDNGNTIKTIVTQGMGQVKGRLHAAAPPPAEKDTNQIVIWGEVSQTDPSKLTQDVAMKISQNDSKLITVNNNLVRTIEPKTSETGVMYVTMPDQANPGRTRQAYVRFTGELDAKGRFKPKQLLVYNDAKGTGEAKTIALKDGGFGYDLDSKSLRLDDGSRRFLGMSLQEALTKQPDAMQFTSPGPLATAVNDLHPRNVKINTITPETTSSAPGVQAIKFTNGTNGIISESLKIVVEREGGKPEVLSVSLQSPVLRSSVGDKIKEVWVRGEKLNKLIPVNDSQLTIKDNKILLDNRNRKVISDLVEKGLNDSMTLPTVTDLNASAVQGEKNLAWMKDQTTKMTADAKGALGDLGTKVNDAIKPISGIWDTITNVFQSPTGGVVPPPTSLPSSSETLTIPPRER